jgi:hypothetical protein
VHEVGHAFVNGKIPTKTRRFEAKPGGPQTSTSRRPLPKSSIFSLLDFRIQLRLRPGFNNTVDLSRAVVHGADMERFNCASFHQQGRAHVLSGWSSLNKATNSNHATFFCSGRTESPVPGSFWQVADWCLHLPRLSCWHLQSILGPGAGVFLASGCFLLLARFTICCGWLAVCFSEDAALPHRQPHQPPSALFADAWQCAHWRTLPGSLASQITLASFPASRGCSAVCSMEDTTLPSHHALCFPSPRCLAVCSPEDTVFINSHPSHSSQSGSVFSGRRCLHLHFIIGSRQNITSGSNGCCSWCWTLIYGQDPHRRGNGRAFEVSAALDPFSFPSVR